MTTVPGSDPKLSTRVAGAHVSADQKSPARVSGAQVSADSIARLHELDQAIEAAHQALRHQLDRLCEQLRCTTELMDGRNLHRLLFVLDHTAYLANHSLTLVNDRSELLRSKYP